MGVLAASLRRPGISSALAIMLVAAALAIGFVAIAMDAVALCLSSDGPVWDCRLLRPAALLPR
jgi:hypothetical protein